MSSVNILLVIPNSSLKVAPREPFLAVHSFSADHNQFRHLVRCYAATPCKVTPPPAATLCRRRFDRRPKLTRVSSALPLREEGAVRRILILVSDGDDNYSRSQESDAIKMCQRAETIVYAISTNISPSKSRGDEVLRVISEATGGLAFYPFRIEDVATGFHRIEEELRSQYSLIYRPAAFKNDGSFRTINLQAFDRRYKVRVHTGYFAPHPTE